MATTWTPQRPAVVWPPVPTQGSWDGGAPGWDEHAAPEPADYQPQFVLPPKRGGLPMPKPPLPTPWLKPGGAGPQAFIPAGRPPLPMPPGYTPTPPAGPAGPARAPAFAVLSSERGPVLAPPEAVPGMLRADWAFFLEFCSYALHDLAPGAVAFGIEEVSEAVRQMAVAVLFIPVGCGHGGEGAVRAVAAAGGRGYIVGLAHELHEDVSAWGAAAVLRQPLERQRALAAPEPAAEGLEPEPKRRRLEDSAAELISAAMPKSAMFARMPGVGAAGPGGLPGLPPVPPPPGGAAAQWWQGPAATPELPQFPTEQEGAPAPELDAAPAAPASPQKPLRPEDHERDLRKAIKQLGKIESLYDKGSIPSFGEALRDRYLPALGAVAVFSALGDAFVAGKGVAHRKAMAYTAHELIMRKRGRALAVEDRRVSLLRHFFMRIAKSIRGFKSDERYSYIRLVGEWQRERSFQPAELAELKEAWDVD